MTLEKNFFLQVLSDFVHGDSTEIPKEELDWDLILKWAEEQCVSGIFYLQCRDNWEGKTKILEILRAGFYSAVFYHTCQNCDLVEIKKEYKEAGIPFLPMKGSIFSNYYPIPQLRTMGDIDAIIHTCDREKSNQIMEKLGFRRMIDNHAVWTYFRDVVTYEIHDHMMYESLANSFDYRGYFDHVWDYVKESEEGYDLNDGFHLLYLLAHTAKHVMNCGSGFRPFLDMCFVVKKKGDSIDWNWVRNELEQIHLYSFACTCFAFCERWFGMEMPFEKNGLDEKFYEDTTEKIFMDGIFGHQNKDNEIGVVTKTVRRSERCYWLAALGITWKKLFPPYRDMQLISWYSFVNGRPWLMPVAWIYRFYYCICHKFNHSKNLLKQPFVEKNRIEQREESISDWGL